MITFTVNFDTEEVITAIYVNTAILCRKAIWTVWTPNNKAQAR